MCEKRYVLIAEDDHDEVSLLRWAFNKAGLNHELIHLVNGAVTIEYLKGTPPFDDRVRHPLPALMLLDLKMPKLNGFDVLAWLGCHPDLTSLPAAVLSSSVFDADARKACTLGAREFLTKPNDLDDLVKLVRGLHDRWLAGEPESALSLGNLVRADASCLTKAE